MSTKSWLTTLGGIAVLGFIMWRLGTGPFLDGLRLIDAKSLVAAIAIGVLITTLSAWRWTVFAAGLAIPLPLTSAIARCYRAIFLNATLPSGVLGDMHRAVGHGREAGSVGRGIRAVIWERVAGQAVQIVVALAILCAFPSPVRSYMPVVVAVTLIVVLVLAAVSKLSVRDAGRLLSGRSWAAVLAVSAIIAAGHLATFLVAARTVGVTAPVPVVLPLILLALMAMLVPANVGGFGPREGVAAWAFSAAGLPAAQGVSTATAYGVLVLAASLPGAIVLLFHWIPRPKGVAFSVPEGSPTKSSGAPLSTSRPY